MYVTYVTHHSAISEELLLLDSSFCPKFQKCKNCASPVRRSIVSSNNFSLFTTFKVAKYGPEKAPYLVLDNFPDLYEQKNLKPLRFFSIDAFYNVNLIRVIGNEEKM